MASMFHWAALAAAAVGVTAFAQEPPKRRIVLRPAVRIPDTETDAPILEASKATEAEDPPTKAPKSALQAPLPTLPKVQQPLPTAPKVKAPAPPTPKEVVAPPPPKPAPLSESRPKNVPVAPVEMKPVEVKPLIEPPALVETKKDELKPAEPIVVESIKEEPKKEDDLALSAKWNHGLELTSKSKQFRVHVGGRYQFDSVWYSASESLQANQGGVGRLEDGFDFRRARFRIDGTMFDTFDWCAEFDFVNGAVGANTPAIDTPVPTELYVEYTKLGTLGALRVGNFKEPYSFEHLTSSRYLQFMERSPNFDPFAERFHNGFSPGFLLHNTYDDQRGTWWLAFVHDTNVPFGFGVGDQHYAYDARLTFLPLLDECANQLIHVGAAYSHRNPVGDRIRLRSRPSVRSSPAPLTAVLADTGTLACTTQDLAGVELVAVFGSWTFQSEYYASWVQDAATIPAPGGVAAQLGSLFFTGWYAEALYFLTGETREYNKKAANFDRVKPRRNLRWCKDEANSSTCDEYCNSTGAWQIGARYSRTDLQDEGVGAVLDDITLGLNWYFTPNMKLQWNYVATHRNAPLAEGWIHGFGMRTHIDF